MNCPFCNRITIIPKNETNFLVAFLDKYPVSPGHTLIIPKRHVASFFELNENEKNEILPLIETIKADLDSEFSPDGFNIGWNDGAAAGQTIFHFHLHIIPRFEGDVADPRGGIRWVAPTKAKYWEE